VEEVPNRVADRRLFQQAGRNLVEQRLKGVVVVLVHDHDLDVALLQLVGSTDSGEAAAKDEDARAPAVSVGFSGHETRLRRFAGPPVIPRG
jgi:cytochrome P450